MPVLSLACHLPHNTPHIPSRYNNEQTTKQTKAINNSYIYINISCKCDTNRAGHFTLDAYASRPVACHQAVAETTASTFPDDDVIKWKHFPRCWTLCEGYPPVDTPHRGHWRGEELWCFLWCAHEQRVEQTLGMSVIWDALSLIVTSRLFVHQYGNRHIFPEGDYQRNMVLLFWQVIWFSIETRVVSPRIPCKSLSSDRNSWYRGLDYS